MGQRTVATRLRVYVGERDSWHGHGLAQAIVSAARDHGLAGATILQGIEGYGAHSRIHVLHPFSLSHDLPLLVEIIDRPERIAEFMPVVDKMLPGGLVTTDPVEVVFYRRREARAQARDARERQTGAGGAETTPN